MKSIEKIKPIHFHIQTVDVDKIDLHPKNSRAITEKRKQALDYSLSKYKLQDKIILNAARKGRYLLIGGHKRLELYKEKGLTQVEVQVAERYLNKKEVEELLLLHNNASGHYIFEELQTHFDKELLLQVGFESFEFEFESYTSKNMELDTDSFENTMKMVFKFTETQYWQVKKSLEEISPIIELALVKLLNLEQES